MGLASRCGTPEMHKGEQGRSDPFAFSVTSHTYLHPTVPRSRDVSQLHRLFPVAAKPTVMLNNLSQEKSCGQVWHSGAAGRAGVSPWKQRSSNLCLEPSVQSPGSAVKCL